MIVIIIINNFEENEKRHGRAPNSWRRSLKRFVQSCSRIESSRVESTATTSSTARSYNACAASLYTVRAVCADAKYESTNNQIQLVGLR